MEFTRYGRHGRIVFTSDELDKVVAGIDSSTRQNDDYAGRLARALILKLEMATRPENRRSGPVIEVPGEREGEALFLLCSWAIHKRDKVDTENTDEGDLASSKRLVAALGSIVARRAKEPCLRFIDVVPGEPADKPATSNETPNQQAAAPSASPSTEELLDSIDETLREAVYSQA